MYYRNAIYNSRHIKIGCHARKTTHISKIITNCFKFTIEYLEFLPPSMSFN